MTYTVTISNISDLAGNLMSAPFSWSFTTAAAVVSSSIWPTNATPSVAAWDDSTSLELGVKFQTDVAGYITGVRFYKGAGNTGTHTGSLWDTQGNLLARATFTNETASGWQNVVFQTPVLITAGTTYVASYFAAQRPLCGRRRLFRLVGHEQRRCQSPLQRQRRQRRLQTGIDQLVPESDVQREQLLGRRHILGFDYPS